MKDTNSVPFLPSRYFETKHPLFMIFNEICTLGFTVEFASDLYSSLYSFCLHFIRLYHCFLAIKPSARAQEAHAIIQR